MITYKKGNLFDNLNPNKKSVVLHIVNDGGAMGSGFAKVAYEKYPAVRADYIEWYKNGGYYSPRNKQFYDFKLGQIQPVRIDDKLTIVNMIAQSRAGGYTFKLFNKEIYLPPFRPDSFRECILRVASLYQNSDVDLMSPLMGCGLGGSTKAVVFGIVDEIFKQELDLTVYEL